MYVAITRARQRLYLAYAHSRSIYGATQHNPASRFLAEMPDETVEKTGVGSMGLSGTGYEKRGDRRGGFGVGPSSDSGRVYGSGRGARAAAGSGARRGSAGAPMGLGSAGRSQSAQPSQPSDTFAVGDVVDHKTFGQGRVVEVNGDQLAVKFARTGETKKLLLGYAPIVKIKQ
jgi:DNA helicase-2/ATP-dependent DNA helicase PcrA